MSISKHATARGDDKGSSCRVRERVACWTPVFFVRLGLCLPAHAFCRPQNFSKTVFISALFEVMCELSHSIWLRDLFGMV